MLDFKRIGLVVAMKKELTPFLNQISTSCENLSSGVYEVTRFDLKTRQIYVIESGIGEISSASATQYLITKYGVDAIINFGVCGSLTPSLKVLSNVVVSGVVHYDFDLSSIDNVEVGRHPEFSSPVIPTDGDFLAEFDKICPNSQKVICASGDKFIDDRETKNRLYKTYKAQVCDMESAGVLLTAHKNKIPALIIKAVSDLDTGDYNLFVEHASKECANKINLLLDKMG